MPLSTLWHDELINLHGNTGSEKNFSEIVFSNCEEMDFSLSWRQKN